MTTADNPRRPTTPFVSVCMAVHNGAAEIEDQLAGLAAQDYSGQWELIVADDGSSDDTLGILSEWENRLPLLVSPGPSFGRPNPARNRAARLARGEFLAFCDHDDVVRPGWISALADGARYFDVVAGVTACDRLNDPIVRSWKDDRPTDQLVIAHGALPGMIGASCGVWTDVFDAIGGFDPIVFGHDDVDIAWRAQFAGYTIGLAPGAIVDYRYRPTLRGLAKQSYHRYRSVPMLLARHRPSLPPRDNTTTSETGVTHHLAQLLLDAPRALIDQRARGRWVNTAARLAGYASGSLALRTGRAEFGLEPSEVTTE